MLIVVNETMASVFDVRDGSWLLSLGTECDFGEPSTSKRGGWRVGRPLQGAAKAYSRFMFQAIVTKLHSP
jgi:hypothetical protein